MRAIVLLGIACVVVAVLMWFGSRQYALLRLESIGNSEEFRSPSIRRHIETIARKSSVEYLTERVLELRGPGPIWAAALSLKGPEGVNVLEEFERESPGFLVYVSALAYDDPKVLQVYFEKYEDNPDAWKGVLSAARTLDDLTYAEYVSNYYSENADQIEAGGALDRVIKLYLGRCEAEGEL
jgi:hypothetical protein